MTRMLIAAGVASGVAFLLPDTTYAQAYCKAIRQAVAIYDMKHRGDTPSNTTAKKQSKPAIVVWRGSARRKETARKRRRTRRSTIPTAAGVDTCTACGAAVDSGAR